MTARMIPVIRPLADASSTLFTTLAMFGWSGEKIIEKRNYTEILSRVFLNIEKLSSSYIHIS